MSNPLDPIISNYKNTREPLKIARACIADTDGDDDGPLQAALAATNFSSIPKDVALDLVQEAQEQLEYLTVLALFSTFERCLRDELASKSDRLSIASPTSALEQNIPGFYEKQCDYFPVRQLLHLFIPDVDRRTIQDDVWPIKEYRDWIAHGRSDANTPIQVMPSVAYDILTGFLETVGLA